MRKRIRSPALLLLGLALLVGLGAVVAFAENVDPFNDGSQYAWGENVGWLNAEPDVGWGVHVSDTNLSGYMWGENIGWISLCCGNTGSCGTVDYCVDNDGAGNLMGYAWGENIGWISFSCDYPGTCGDVDYGVSIDPVTGVFSGYAWGENIGWISFSDDSPVAYQVQTSWSLATPTTTPTPAPLETDGATIGSGGGTVPADPVSPADPVDASVSIPPGALTGDTEITITEFSATDPGLPSPPAGSLPRVLEFGPESTTFAEDVTIVISYDDSAVPGGVNEADLQVNLLVSGSYVPVETCTSTGPPVPDPCVFARDTGANTITIRTRQFSIYSVSQPACIDREGDTQCDDPVNDPDDDGCTNDQEAALGDNFDPDAWYDVFDVPVPAKEDAEGDGCGDDVPPIGANGKRNTVVDIGDVLAVLFYAFADDNGPCNANGVDYDAIKGVDLDADTDNDIPPPLHPIEEGVKYDRSPGEPPSTDSGKDPAGAPNGVIDIGDVLAALAQAFVVDCSG